ncbi:MAG: RNA polymerase sigma factor [Christensenellaceae bacterium]|nr:RNA polymerase sigma factor [Christensenellaceae bacterium]
MSERELTAIYHRRIDMVYRLCFSMMGSRQDAEDAAQTVFLKLMRREEGFADEEHEKAFLIVMARNQCHDFRRQWWRRNTKALDESMPGGEIPGEQGEARQLLLKLPPRLRILLVLHFVEGYRLADIAQMLGMNLNTVKSRLRSAKKKLKMEWGRQEE